MNKHIKIYLKIIFIIASSFFHIGFILIAFQDNHDEVSNLMYLSFASIYMIGSLFFSDSGKVSNFIAIFFLIILSITVTLFGVIPNSDSIMSSCDSETKDIIKANIYIRYIPDYIRYFSHKKIGNDLNHLKLVCQDIRKMGDKNNFIYNKKDKVGENKINSIILDFAYSEYLNRKLDLGVKIYNERVNRITERYEKL